MAGCQSPPHRDVPGGGEDWMARKHAAHASSDICFERRPNWSRSMAKQRIISLIASATEIVCALGFEDQLVGRSHECDFPHSVAHVPALTEPKFNPEGTSAEIDQRVKQIVADALSVYRVDAPKLRELRPDVIVTQSQCEVCAVSESDVEAAVAEWLGARPKIVSLAPYGLDDVFTDMQRVADALGAPSRGVDLVASLRARLSAISGIPHNSAPRP